MSSHPPPPSSKHDAALASISHLLNWSLATPATDPASSALQLNSAYWTVCSLTNKFIDESSPAFLDLLDAFWGTHIKAPSNSRRVALQMWMWLTRALVVKSSKLAEAMLNRVLIEIFDDVAGKIVGRSDPSQLLPASRADSSGAGVGEWKFAQSAARDLSAIVGASEDGIATKENGFTVRLLWKQKLFSFLIPRLLRATRQRQSSHVVTLTMFTLMHAHTLPKKTRLGRLRGRRSTSSPSQGCCLRCRRACWWRGWRGCSRCSSSTGFAG